MREIVYELAIIGGRLPDDKSIAFDLIQRLALATKGGDAVGPWEYHFKSFDAAKMAEESVRRTGVSCDSIRIRTVDAGTGKELPS